MSNRSFYIQHGGGNTKHGLLLLILLVLAALGISIGCHAQTNNNHLMVNVGALYERGLEATVAYEHSGRYHNAWEYFGTYYIKYEDDPDAGHITKKSFWHSYNSWHVGIAYKPCVRRGRNHHGNLRIGASCGSNLDNFIGGIHVGYEHTYCLRGGWELFYQVKEDVILPRHGDLFRTGIALGFKVPL